MGELTFLVCSIGSVVLLAMVLVVALVCSLDRTDSNEEA